MPAGSQSFYAIEHGHEISVLALHINEMKRIGFAMERHEQHQ